jgi:hypothetical protein
MFLLQENEEIHISTVHQRPIIEKNTITHRKRCSKMARVKLVNVTKAQANVRTVKAHLLTLDL